MSNRKLPSEIGRELHAAAMRYAAFDKSDPFSYRRAISHMQSGVSTYANGTGAKAYYDASAIEVTKSYFDSAGKERTYKVVEYKDVVRP